jgi:hypothetical protein
MASVLACPSSNRFLKTKRREEERREREKKKKEGRERRKKGEMVPANSTPPWPEYGPCIENALLFGLAPDEE